MTLHQETLDLLKKRSRLLTFKVIAANTTLTEPWLNSFSTGKYSNTSLEKVQKLNDYLKSQL